MTEYKYIFNELHSGYGQVWVVVLEQKFNGKNVKARREGGRKQSRIKGLNVKVATLLTIEDRKFAFQKQTNITTQKIEV